MLSTKFKMRMPQKFISTRWIGTAMITNQNPVLIRSDCEKSPCLYATALTGVDAGNIAPKAAVVVRGNIK